MFTGLIEETGIVKSVRRYGEGRRISIEASLILEDVKGGDSICIDGACQTVESFSQGLFTVFASEITCSLTTLGEYAPGSPVNLERALRPSSRFGGHFVQGHIDGTGVVKSTERDISGLLVSIEAEDNILNYIVEKGSIAVDGISLTVTSLQKNCFFLYIIPETIKSTTADAWKPGTLVNLETDIIAKYIEKFTNRALLEEDRDSMLMKKLSDGGFV